MKLCLTTRTRAAAVCCLLGGLLIGCAPANGPAPNAAAVLQLRTGAAVTPVTPAPLAATGWGALQGKFVVQGTVPSPSTIPITRDAKDCGEHLLKDESLHVGSGGELANVVVYVRRKLPAPLIHPDFAKSKGAEIALDNHNCRFEPHVCLLTTKDVLRVKNSDPVGHNTNLAGRNGFNELIGGGGFVHKAMAKRDGIPAIAVCNIHPWMSGYIFAQDNPYLAKTAADGTFTIENLPAGVALDFQIWHERPASKKFAATGNINIPESGRFTVTIPADGTLDLGTLNVYAENLLK